MRAIFCEAYGGPEVLRYGELPAPVVRPGEVLVTIHAASVNGADWKGACRRLRRRFAPAGHRPGFLGRGGDGERRRPRFAANHRVRRADGSGWSLTGPIAAVVASPR